MYSHSYPSIDVNMPHALSHTCASTNVCVRRPTFSTTMTFGRSSRHPSMTDASSAKFGSIFDARSSELNVPCRLRPAYGRHSHE